MDGIGNLLEKIKHSLFLKTALNRSISEVIESRIKAKIPEQNITFKDGVVRVKVSPIIKSEILINKKEIIETLKEKHPSITISNII